MFSLEAYKELITIIASTMDNNSIEVRSGTVRLAYSGRGMYGATCLGISLDSYDMDTFRHEVLEELTHKLKGFPEDDDRYLLLKKFKEQLKHPSRDSMGMGMIEYFEQLKVPAEYQEELTELVKKYIFED
ncbi:MAG: hypothetical protein VYA60_07925 [Pseudomonadota bacterium]|nr:hypothetical protein [Pseudomonadota bacterium]